VTTLCVVRTDSVFDLASLSEGVMEERLDAWLKTYRAEKMISPIDWETVPDECRIRLDNFARDAAVRRADSFAHEGSLDLRRQEAIRQLVDAMAQSWRLSGEEVRNVVEEFYDELPPKSGMEFEKLATRLFRRKLNASASEVFNGFDPSEEHPVIAASARYLDVPPNQMLDKSGFLHACHNAYDTWTTKQSKDAVLEILKTTGKGGSAIVLQDLLVILDMRGARTWATALKLEQDIGVDTASQDELIRILKRYALMVRRGGPEAIGLTATQPVPEARPAIDSDLTEEAVTSTARFSLAQEETPQADSELIEATSMQDETDEHVKTEHVEEDVVETPIDDTREEFYDPPALIEQESENVAELAPLEEPDLETESSVEAEANDDQTDLDGDTAKSTQQDATELEQQPETISQEETGEPMIKDPNRFQVRALDDLDDDDLEAIEYLFGENAIQYEDDSDDESSEEDDEDEPAHAGGTSNGMQIRQSESLRPTRDESRAPVIEASRSRKDRFLPLRSGDLRRQVVRAIYGNDDRIFDIFLAKLSNAPDWKSGKKVIAEEMLDNRVNLEEEPARELFFTLKRCMSVTIN
jgi:hypothetical protein